MSSWHTMHSSHVPPPPIPEGVVPAPMSPEFVKQTRNRSGLEYTWRLWRHCCCRYGWYPLVVAPIISTGCLLSLYSAVGCDFVRVNIGFVPSNQGWNQSTVDIGLFLYQSGENEVGHYWEAILDGCRPYPDLFSDIYIDDDRTWRVARIMGYISGVASLVAMITSWLFVVTPLSACFFWPGVLLPSLTAAFLAEGSKFLLFDTSVCRNSVWFPSGTDSLPRIAADCSLGSTSYCCIAAGAIFFVSLMFVCLKAPERRILDSDYGTRVTDLEHGGSQDTQNNLGLPGHDDSFAERDMYSDHDYSVSRVSSIRDDRSEMQLSAAGISRSSREYRYDSEGHFEGADSSSGRFQDELRAHGDLISERMRSLDSKEDRRSLHSRSSSRIADTNEESSHSGRYNPRKPPRAPTSVPVKPLPQQQPVSESRLHTAERLILNSTNTSNDMIEKFMKEVDRAFCDEGPHQADEDVPDDDDVCRNESQSVSLQSSARWPTVPREIPSSQSY